MKESTVNVSSSRVTKVNAVRSLRRFMFETPSMKAVIEALERLTSVSRTTATSVRSFFICSLKRLPMIHMTSTASVKTMKAKRMTKGLDSSKAGCTIDRTDQIAMKMTKNPMI